MQINDCGSLRREGKIADDHFGIDSHNIDDTRTRSRPVHSILLRAGIPIVEHLTQLGTVPDDGFRFHAVPPKISGMGTFAVRAYAVIG